MYMILRVSGTPRLKQLTKVETGSGNECIPQLRFPLCSISSIMLFLLSPNLIEGDLLLKY